MLGEVLALLAAIVWAFSSLLYKIGLKNTDPLIANTYRLAIATLILLPVTVQMNVKYNIDFIYLQISAIFGIGVADFFFLKSLKYINVSRAVPISSSYPFFTMMLGIVFLKEPLEIAFIISAVLILLGIYLLSEEKSENEVNVKLGVLFAILTAFLWGLSIVLAKLGLRSYNYIEATALRLPTATLFSILLMYFLKKNVIQLFKMPSKFYITMGTAGILGIIVGGLLFMASLSLTTASVASILSSTTPFFTAVVSNIYLREKITLKKILGMTLVVSGIYIIYA